MVKPDVQLVRHYFDILAKGNMEALGQLFADDVVWHQPGKGSLSGVYRGKKELFTLLGKFMEWRRPVAVLRSGRVAPRQSKTGGSL